MSVEIRTYRDVSEQLLDYLTELEDQIFEKPYSREKIKRELVRKKNLIALVAFDDGQAKGFKVGFEMTTSMFYSWIGGVIAQERGKGIARQLMEQQHSIAREAGFDYVRTETENRFKSMLILNLKCGFDVVGIRSTDQYPRTVITLEKKL